MISSQIRQKFLNYFKKNGHTIVPSSPVIPHDDPTLLFINAGMNQFKDVFLGKSVRAYKRATSSQKCIRVGGKHNDLENVGHTSRHLTFFEMLGNFSFGDYFKKEAIAFAWEVTLNVFDYNPDHLWATVFYEDEEAFALWKQYLPEKRIVRMGEKDNFWAMGDTGPCGPCSELLYDRGTSYGDARSPSEDIRGERYLEFWNLVFMQFNRDVAGKMDPLPKPCVDTGAGLERVVSLKIGVESLFETDLLRELIAEVEGLTGILYNPHEKEKAPAFRVIADHLRSLAFAIGDGVQPSNIDRGYVLRKILRRAVRYGKMLGLEKPFLAKILPRLIAIMGNDFPEIKTSSERIAETLTLEEESFFRTLKRGGNILQQIIASSHKHAGQISGEDAFKLKDTYGLPLEEVMLLAKDAHLTVDIQTFEVLEKEAKERSRASRSKDVNAHEENQYAAFLEEHGPTQFVGYHEQVADSLVLGLLKEGSPVEALYEGEEGTLLVQKTPFYAEKGGQVGDQGTITSQENVFSVLDAQAPYPDVVTHHGRVRSGEIRLGDAVTLTIDTKRRKAIAANHTATHLLHWALQRVLGAHIRQAGSIVESNRLRFDFSHHKPLSEDDILQIEALVNEKIRENKQVEVYELSFEEAQKRKEIKQFFGEKYGNKVRVIDIDSSKELCGGTHASFTGEIGYFRIAKEASISSGVRRIEAVTGKDAEALVVEGEKLIASLAQLLKTSSHHLFEKTEKLVEEYKAQEKTLSAFHKQNLAAEVEKLLNRLEMIHGLPLLMAKVDAKELREYAEAIFEKKSSLILVLAEASSDKCALFVRVSPDLVQKGFSANELIKQLLPVVGGKGGGKSDSAQGGGMSPQNLESAFEKAREWVKGRVG